MPASLTSGTEVFGLLRTIAACPFCGHGDPRMAEEHAGYGMNYFVMCSECGAQGPGENTAQGAIESWIKRTEDWHAHEGAD